MSPATPRRTAARPAAALPPRPELGPDVRGSVPRVSERTLANGLRVLAVKRDSVPLAELRLRIPFAGKARGHVAAGLLLAETFFAGTSARDAAELAAAIQATGGALGAGVDADTLSVGGSSLATEFPALLALLAEVLEANAYPAGEVAGERDRLVEEIGIARRVPSQLAGEAVARRRFGRHPYGFGLPTAAELAETTDTGLRRLHRRRVSPQGALLVVVGALEPRRALDAVEAALGGWSATGGPETLPPVGDFTPGGFALTDRPGSVQTSIRLVAPGPRRTDPDYADLVAALTLSAGYFSSRLVGNIREDKGYTYSPHAGVDHDRLASTISIDADVATGVTAPALLEMSYEMGKIAVLPPTEDELESARRYLVGTLALATATQAGLAGTLAGLAVAGLDASWLRTYPAALAKTTPAKALAAAERWLAPARSAAVLVGDAAEITAPVSALGEVTAAPLEQ